MSDTVIPLIYTSKGNLPINSLEYTTSWEEPPTEAGLLPSYTKFIETYRLDGEVVRQSAHVYHRGGSASDAIPGHLN